MKARQIAIHFIALFSFCACSPKTSYVARYGIAFNVDRERLGVPTIPVSWTIQDMGDYFDCFDPSPNDKAPHRLSKRVFIKKGIVESEIDTFYSGKTFYYAPEQITVPQEISIEYSYLQENSRNPWVVHADLDPNHRFAIIPIREARLILSTWGLSWGLSNTNVQAENAR